MLSIRSHTFEANERKIERKRDKKEENEKKEKIWKKVGVEMTRHLSK